MLENNADNNLTLEFLFFANCIYAFKCFGVSVEAVKGARGDEYVIKRFYKSMGKGEWRVSLRDQQMIGGGIRNPF